MTRMTMKRLIERFLGWCVRISVARERPLIIAVAGSVGKSSTKTAIGIALGAGELGTRVAVSAKNYNNELGIPLAIFGCDAPGRSVWKWLVLIAKAKLVAFGLARLRAKTFVLEMAADHPGDLAYLTRIAPPTMGVLTAVGPEHTEFLGDVDGVLKEESTVLTVLPPDGVAVINADDPLVREAANDLSAKRTAFGMAEDAIVRLLSTEVAIDAAQPASSGLDVTVCLYNVQRTFRLVGTVGRPQAYAAAAAIAVGDAMDLDVDEMVGRIADRFHGMAGRMRLLEGIKHTWLIDDSYNSSPLAAHSAIRDLAAFPVSEGGRRIAAMGDMLELGSLSEEAHRDMGCAIAENGIDMLVACGTLAHVVAEAAVARGMSSDAVFTFAKSSEAGLFIQDRLKEHDVVLVKGSQGARMERISKELMAHPEKAEKLLVRHTKDWLERS